MTGLKKKLREQPDWLRVRTEQAVSAAVFNDRMVRFTRLVSPAMQSSQSVNALIPSHNK